MLNHKSTRSARLFWLGALLGAAVFLLVYGLAPLDAANDAFCRGGYIEKDIQQHYAGWLFYRSSALGWPLGVTQAIKRRRRQRCVHRFYPAAGRSVPPAGSSAGRDVPVFRLVYPCLLCFAGRLCVAAVRAVC